MSYSIVIAARAQRQLRGIENVTRQRISAAIDELVTNPRPPGCRKLQGRNAWRIRIGDYRVIYEIEDDKLIVTVIDVGHRRDIYR